MVKATCSMQFQIKSGLSILAHRGRTTGDSLFADSSFVVVLRRTEGVGCDASHQFWENGRRKAWHITKKSAHTVCAVNDHIFLKGLKDET